MSATAALDVFGYIFIGIGILVVLGLIARFIGWISDLTDGVDTRRADPLRLRIEQTAMKIEAHKAAYDMIRAAEECLAQDEERRNWL